MRHLRHGRKLNRSASHRKALMNNLTTSLLEKGRIITTTAKAKEMRGVVERVITFAKRGDLHARRIAAKTVKNETVLKKLFDTIGPDFKERAGGYTRIFKSRMRRGDAAELAIIELVNYVPKEKVVREKKGGKSQEPVEAETKEKKAESSK